ncbi:meiosis-specific nuclear structural protein 1-like [Spodoptera litura]|uniref:Meiosis-specific nuclear structural protein 1 n=1 Tax=Spodoptera litura TaxID=69820 RepID=A0A9J7IW53_SPOLT|nr:meiosis-specific nuclear structural protein 1-like [Spodoptera litura]
MEPKTELQKNAIAEARSKELNVYQRALDMQWLDSRMADGRMGRCLALIQREAEMEREFQERTDHAAIVNARAERETKLGTEVANVRREEVCQLLRRHYLRERDPSLRDLARKLQAGYVCRDIQQQIINNEYRRLQEKAEEMRANNILLNALADDKEAMAKEEKEKMDRTSQYCKELQQQLVNRHLQKQCQYEDSLIEKKMLEDIIRTISDEDKKELQQKRAITERMRHEMKTFLQARDAWKQKQKLMVIQEEKNIEEQNKMVTDRSSAILAARDERMRKKEEFTEKMSAKILADDAKRQDRMNTIKLLQEQEYLEKNFQDDIAERNKAERVRHDTYTALTKQIEDRRRQTSDGKQREAEYRKQVEAKIAADLAKEREDLQKKKEKGKLYSQELLKQIEANAIKKKRDTEMEEQRTVYVKEYDRKWREEVAKEREKMVSEHVPGLLGYVTAGALRHSDLGALRAVRPHLAHLDVDRLATARPPHRFGKCNPQCRMLREY